MVLNQSNFKIIPKYTYMDYDSPEPFKKREN